MRKANRAERAQIWLQSLSWYREAASRCDSPAWKSFYYGLYCDDIKWLGKIWGQLPLKFRRAVPTETQAEILSGIPD